MNFQKLILNEVFFGLYLGREKKCRYKGKRYPQGATIDRPVTPDYAHCERCTCVGRKFKNCKKIYHCELGYLPCGKEDYEFLPGECCPVCKQKGQ